jgi:serpin B
MNRMRIVISIAGLAATVALGAGGCGQAQRGTKAVLDMVAPLRGEIAVATSLPALGDPDRAAPVEFSSGINDFGFDLLRQIDSRHPDKNSVISPLSVANVLAMTAAGADGRTLVQLRAALAVEDLDEATTNRGWADLLADLQSGGPTYDTGTTLYIANALWLQEDRAFAEPFLGVNRDYFGSELREIDLRSPGAADAINRWVAKNTRGTIDGIVSTIGPDAALYVTNATYFKAPWQVPFNEASTKEEPFTAASGTTVTASMMHLYDEMMYAEDENVQIVGMPYVDNRFRMYVVLPSKSSSLTALEDTLSADGLNALFDSMEFREGSLGLPRFTADYRDGLTEILAALGVVDAFDPDTADFSRLSEPGVAGPVWLGGLDHAAYMNVDEYGTEAAAVTSSMVCEAGLAEEGPPPFKMICDRPFLALVVHEPSGMVLFAAAVRDPS